MQKINIHNSATYHNILVLHIFKNFILGLVVQVHVILFLLVTEQNKEGEKKNIISIIIIDHFSNILYFANKWKQRYIHWRSQRLYCCKRKYRKEKKRKEKKRKEKKEKSVGNECISNFESLDFSKLDGDLELFSRDKTN